MTITTSFTIVFEDVKVIVPWDTDSPVIRLAVPAWQKG